MSEFSTSEMEAALAHFRRLRSSNPSASARPAASHVGQTIRNLEGQLLRSDAALKNARSRHK